MTKINVSGPKGRPPCWGNAWARGGCAKGCKKTFRVLTWKLKDMGASVQLGSTRGNIRNLPGNLNRKRAQTVAHMRPMPGQAHLLGDETAPQPSRKEVSKARHDFLDQQRQDAGGMGSLLPAASRSAEVATPIGLHAGAHDQ